MSKTEYIVMAALGLALIIEGTPYFLFAEKMRTFLAKLAELHPTALRGVGLFSILSGLLLVYLATKLGR